MESWQVLHGGGNRDSGKPDMAEENQERRDNEGQNIFIGIGVLSTLGSSEAIMLGLLSATSQSLSFLSVDPVASSPGAPGLKDIAQVGLSWA